MGDPQSKTTEGIGSLSTFASPIRPGSSKVVWQARLPLPACLSVRPQAPLKVQVVRLLRASNVAGRERTSGLERDLDDRQTTPPPHLGLGVDQTQAPAFPVKLTHIDAWALQLETDSPHTFPAAVEGTFFESLFTPKQLCNTTHFIEHSWLTADIKSQKRPTCFTVPFKPKFRASEGQDGHHQC